MLGRLLDPGYGLGKHSHTDMQIQAISSRLIVLDWNVIVVGDGVLSSLVLVSQVVPGGEEGRDGKLEGGRVINTDRAESVLV